MSRHRGNWFWYKKKHLSKTSALSTESSSHHCSTYSCGFSAKPLAVIIGMPAAGKTRIGRELAKLMHLAFFDTDELVEREIKIPIAEYFRKYGEQAFRQVEERVVRQAITGSSVDNDEAFRELALSAENSISFATSSSESRIACKAVSSAMTQVVPEISDHCQSCIVALGGGAPMCMKTRALLREYVQHGGRVVYLQADVKEAVERVSWNNNRPIFAGTDGAKRWKELFAERDPVFRMIANVHVRTHGSTPRMAAEKVMDMITQRIVSVSGGGVEPYDVRIGQSALCLLPQMLGTQVSRVVR